MDSFTEEQKALIEKVAWEVGDKIHERMIIAIRAQITSHVASCQTTKRLKAVWFLMLGVAIGFGLGGGGIGYLVAQILAKYAI